MKSRSDMCYAITWCTICKDSGAPCEKEVPDYIPNDQILKYLEEKYYV